MEYRTFYVTTDKEGHGIIVHTDIQRNLRMEDMYTNPLTAIGIVEYLSPTGLKQTSRFTCEDFYDIQIKEIK